MSDEQEQAAVRVMDFVRPVSEPQTILTVVDKPKDVPYIPAWFKPIPGDVLGGSVWDGHVWLTIGSLEEKVFTNGMITKYKMSQQVQAADKASMREAMTRPLVSCGCTRDLPAAMCDCMPTRHQGLGQQAASNQFSEDLAWQFPHAKPNAMPGPKLYCVACDGFHAEGEPHKGSFGYLGFTIASAPVPGEIYCLADLSYGQREPSQTLKDQMGAALYEHARATGLKGTFTRRTGIQYKIATDTLQYYIIHRYGDEVVI